MPREPPVIRAVRGARSIVKLPATLLRISDQTTESFQQDRAAPFEATAPRVSGRFFGPERSVSGDEIADVGGKDLERRAGILERDVHVGGPRERSSDLAGRVFRGPLRRAVQAEG